MLFLWLLWLALISVEGILAQPLDPYYWSAGTLTYQAMNYREPYIRKQDYMDMIQDASLDTIFKVRF